MGPGVYGKRAANARPAGAGLGKLRVVGGGALARRFSLENPIPWIKRAGPSTGPVVPSTSHTACIAGSARRDVGVDVRLGVVGPDAAQDVLGERAERGVLGRRAICLPGQVNELGAGRAESVSASLVLSALARAQGRQKPAMSPRV